MGVTPWRQPADYLRRRRRRVMWLAVLLVLSYNMTVAHAGGAEVAASIPIPPASAAERALYTLAHARVHTPTNILLMTSVSYNYLDMYDNWLCSLQAQGFTNYVVFASDEASYRHLLARNEPVFTSSTVLARVMQSNDTYTSDGASALSSLSSTGEAVLEAFSSGRLYHKDKTYAERVAELVKRIEDAEDLQTYVADSSTSSSSPTLSSSPKTADFATWQFELLMLRRLRFMNRLLDWGFNVFLNDCDTVWQRSPLLYYPSQSYNIDILAQDETPHAPQMPAYICTGNFIVFSTDRGIGIWNEAVDVLDEYLLQRILAISALWNNEASASSSSSSSSSSSIAEESAHLTTIDQNEQHFLHELSLREKWRASLRLLFWDRDLFASGKYYFVQRGPQRARVVPAVIHNTWIVGHDNKVQRFKQFRLWFLTKRSPSSPPSSLSSPSSELENADRVPDICTLSPPSATSSPSSPSSSSIHDRDVTLVTPRKGVKLPLLSRLSQLSSYTFRRFERPHLTSARRKAGEAGFVAEISSRLANASRVLSSELSVYVGEGSDDGEARGTAGEINVDADALDEYTASAAASSTHASPSPSFSPSPLLRDRRDYVLSMPEFGMYSRYSDIVPALPEARSVTLTNLQSVDVTANTRPADDTVAANVAADVADQDATSSSSSSSSSSTSSSSLSWWDEWFLAAYEHNVAGSALLSTFVSRIARVMESRVTHLAVPRSVTSSSSHSTSSAYSSSTPSHSSASSSLLEDPVVASGRVTRVSLSPASSTYDISQLSLNANTAFGSSSAASVSLSSHIVLLTESFAALECPTCLLSAVAKEGHKASPSSSSTLSTLVIVAYASKPHVMTWTPSAYRLPTSPSTTITTTTPSSSSSSSSLSSSSSASPHHRTQLLPLRVLDKGSIFTMFKHSGLTPIHHICVEERTTVTSPTSTSTSPPARRTTGASSSRGRGGPSNRRGRAPASPGDGDGVDAGAGVGDGDDANNVGLEYRLKVMHDHSGFGYDSQHVDEVKACSENETARGSSSSSTRSPPYLSSRCTDVLIADRVRASLSLSAQRVNKARRKSGHRARKGQQPRTVCFAVARTPLTTSVSATTATSSLMTP